MHLLPFLVVLLVTATQASDVIEFLVVLVTCGQPFTLHCSFNESGSCAWQRNGSVVKADGRRYSSQEVKLDKGTNCSFHAANAEINSDFGNWTCGATANDAHNGLTFRTILVNVTKNSPNCTNFEDPPLTQINLNSIEKDASDSDSSNDTLYIIIGALSSLLLLFVLGALIYYCKRGGRFNKVRSPTSSFHEYEEIDANYSSLPNANANVNERQDSSTKPNCQSITLKIGSTETMIPITEIFNENGVEMPLTNDKPILSKLDSGATFKLIAVRQPAAQNQRNSTNFQDGVRLTHFPSQPKLGKKLHDYQNIRPTI